MTLEQYFEIIKERWQKVNPNNLEQVKAYNEFKRRLRKEVDDEDEV